MPHSSAGALWQHAEPAPHLRLEEEVATDKLKSYWKTIAITGHICHVSAMKFDAFLQRVPPEGVFRTGQILAGERSPDHVRRQLHRWSRQGRIIKLRRGVYMLGERNTGKRPHPFVIANYLKRGSYISLQSALSHYGMIPEYVPIITSVTTGRPETLHNEAGHFQFRHIGRRLFLRFDSLQIGDEQHAFVATPEKALLDLLYLTADSDNIAYLRELRLTPPADLGTGTPGPEPLRAKENVGTENVGTEEFLHRLHEAANETGVGKLQRAAELIGEILQ
ncbi:MAG: type IV toxin-antitoxin system AbiEi family antitoxin domain-containing protein [bacterium]